jgi:hypothetical protein
LEEDVAPTRLPEDVKKRAEAIAEKKGWTVQDPGTIWAGMDGRKWVFAVDKATDTPVRIPLENDATVTR